MWRSSFESNLISPQRYGLPPKDSPVFFTSVQEGTGTRIHKKKSSHASESTSVRFVIGYCSAQIS
jgi:hypothetical protein